MIDEINKILSEWDPIGIGHPLSLDEYKMYASDLDKLRPDEEQVKSCVIQILKKIGLEYIPNNYLQSRDVNEIVRKILIAKKYSR